MSLIQAVQGHRALCTLVDCSLRVYRSFIFPDLIHAALPWGAWWRLTLTVCQYVCVCLCACVCAHCNGASKSTYQHFLQTAKPQGPPDPRHSSEPPHFVNTCCLIAEVNTNYIFTRLSWTPLNIALLYSLPQQYPAVV